MSGAQVIDSGQGTRGFTFKRANPSTIQQKFLVGYQGWFTCPGDGNPLNEHGWSHWLSRPISAGGRPTTDTWPDVSQYPPSELFPVSGFSLKSGEQTFVFSSRHPKTVQRHFNWMAQYGIDGAFLQRFVGQCDPNVDNQKVLLWRDEIGDHVKNAAEMEGRVFAIMYDVCGVAPSRVQEILEKDWIHLIRDKCVLDSPNYLRECGRPVLCLCGFGFRNSAGHDPDTVRAITSYIRRVTPGGAYIIAGVPSHWRTGDGEADPNKRFLEVWLNEFDAILPWSVGRYKDEEEADSFARNIMKKDIEFLSSYNAAGRCRLIDYIPVVLPGGSGYNMSEGRWAFNNIKRLGGRFLWRQVFNACNLGAKSIYGATWDEYDEGTALMPTVESRLSLPVSMRHPFMALDEDGYDVPADWYMRICGLAAKILRGDVHLDHTFPLRALQGFWSGHPGLIGNTAEHEHSSHGEQPPPPYFEGSTPTSASASRLREKHPALCTRQRIVPAGARPLPAIPSSAQNTRVLESNTAILIPSAKVALDRDSLLTRRASTVMNLDTWDSTSPSLSYKYADPDLPNTDARPHTFSTLAEGVTESNYHIAVQSRAGPISSPTASSISDCDLYEFMPASYSGEDHAPSNMLAHTVSVTHLDPQAQGLPEWSSMKSDV